MKGVNQDEKGEVQISLIPAFSSACVHADFLGRISDPEEFLNMLFKHTLHVTPFINIK